MGDDTSAREIVIDHSRVDPATPDQTRLLDRLDDKLLDPVWDGVNFSSRVQLLISSSSFLKLASIGVAFSKEILRPEMKDIIK